MLISDIRYAYYNEAKGEARKSREANMLISYQKLGHIARR